MYLHQYLEPQDALSQHFQPFVACLRMQTADQVYWCLNLARHRNAVVVPEMQCHLLQHAY